MDDGQRLLEQDDAQTAEQSLHAHGGEGQEPERAQPRARRPERGGEGQGEQPNPGSEQTMAVLVEDSAHHLGPRVEEHVVPERGRPVRNGQGGPGVGHQAAEENQHKGGDHGRHRQPVRHRAQCRPVAAPARASGWDWGRKSALDSGELYS